MANNKTSRKVSAQPRFHQRASEIQAYGTVNHLLALELEEPVRLEMTAQVNQLLADTMTLRDLYKKPHWQVAGPTFCKPLESDEADSRNLHRIRWVQQRLETARI